MSNATLEMLTAATVEELPNATPAEQGEFLAALISHIDATIAPAKPKAVKKPATIVNAKGQRVRPNVFGTLMLADAGTATKNQRSFLRDRGMSAKSVAKLSMAGASDLRAKLTGKAPVA